MAYFQEWNAAYFAHMQSECARPADLERVVRAFHMCAFSEVLRHHPSHSPGSPINHS
jgi:hypothetical protein